MHRQIFVVQVNELSERNKLNIFACFERFIRVNFTLHECIYNVFKKLIVLCSSCSIEIKAYKTAVLITLNFLYFLLIFVIRFT